jgi:pimeloyl-ACP methyl ester carboxylesterase
VIECGSIEVPAHSDGGVAETASLSVYRRAAVSGDNNKTLFLLPDVIEGISARELAEKAPLMFGSTTRDFDVIAITPRGALGSTLPEGSEHLVSTLHNVNDLEQVRSAVRKSKVSVLAWGSGATAAAAWVMLYPKSVDRVVLDTPGDPSMSPLKQAQKQMEASSQGIETALRWCASHLACPMNANVATELNKFRTSLRFNLLPDGVNFDTVARAGSRALADGHPQYLFDAIAQATNGSAESLTALAGKPSTEFDALYRCANVSKEDAALIAAKYQEVQYRHFGIGIEKDLYQNCAALPDAVSPLGTVVADDDAKDADVMVTIARGDPIWAPYIPRNMAKRMTWQYNSVYANRHLVVGFDRAITVSAMEFLAD